ncbi:elongin-C-like [Aphis gossypii]|uniref:elongin-C-like n=1 Tax=Aphis gossypii TaxID=80765 RepID=UPI0021591391|nr:elongin-C-like [Aphis gossypii]XP_050061953.1 elongin-C-like [Aphis gossypii]
MADFNAKQQNQNDSKLEMGSGCLGPNSKYVKLISSDGRMFIVKREHALMSGTIKAMLEGPGKYTETDCNEINLKNIPSHILYHICLYFTYKYYYDFCTDSSSIDIPPFDIHPNIAVPLMMAANFLDC